MSATPTAAAPIAAAERKLILEVARGPAEVALRRRIGLREKSLRIEGDWAFLLAELQEPGGQPIDYRGTPMAAAAEQGFLSRDYAALLKRTEGRWHIVAEAVGPADVAWEDWPERYGAPKRLFALPLP